MLTRRHWLATSAAAITASTLKASAPTLKNRSAEAKPITVAERLARIDHAQRLMQENNIDAITLIGGTSLVYFSGIRWWNSERLFVMIIPRRGEPFFVSPAFEEDRAREQITAGLGPDRRQVLTWQEDESPYERVAFGLKERGMATGQIGIEERVTFVFVDGISKAIPTATVTSATPITAGCRMIKSAHEIDLMRLANQVTLQAYEWSWRQLRDGMTQRDFSGLISSAYQQLGFPGEASVMVGIYSALPHGSVQPQIIREGQIILIDDGCTVEDYQSDISRSFVLGKPTDKMRRVFDIVHQAQAAALKTARTGIPAGDVDSAARNLITAAGYGPDYKYFTHRVGHGIGMDGHEWPYLVRGNKLLLAPNMTFSDEPGIYIPGEFGIRLEDDMHITESGAQLFTPQSASLEHPFAT
jgi:Xaa-Pro dipeptidase